MSSEALTAAAESRLDTHVRLFEQEHRCRPTTIYVPGELYVQLMASPRFDGEEILPDEDNDVVN